MPPLSAKAIEALKSQGTVMFLITATPLFSDNALTSNVMQTLARTPTTKNVTWNDNPEPIKKKKAQYKYHKRFENFRKPWTDDEDISLMMATNLKQWCKEHHRSPSACHTRRWALRHYHGMDFKKLNNAK